MTLDREKLRRAKLIVDLMMIWNIEFDLVAALGRPGVPATDGEVAATWAIVDVLNNPTEARP